MALVNFVFLLLVVLLLCASQKGVADARKNVDRGGDQRLRRQIHVKSIKTTLGHIYDCVDIHQQPALHHPLLKNHKVQMKPSFFPEQSIDGTSSSSNYSEASPTLVNCPLGTVPIRRTAKDDMRRIRSFTESYTTRIHPQTPDHPGKQFAILKTKGDSNVYRGSSAFVNVQQPKVNNFQSSASQLTVERTYGGEFFSLQAGLIVSPQLNGDHLTHLFAFWQILILNGSQIGCFNTNCRGFIQTNAKFPVDNVIAPVSKYGGQQYAVDIQIVQDQQSSNWWLIIARTNHIGYWPNPLVSELSTHGATYLAWGGVTSEIPEGPSPPLGTGKEFTHDRFNPTTQSWVRRVKMFNQTFHEVDPGEDEVETYIDNNDCYGGWDWGYLDTQQGHVFSFGGPGGNCHI